MTAAALTADSPSLKRLSSRYIQLLGVAALLALAGCGSRAPSVPEPTPEERRGKLVRLIPAGTSDREGWAKDIQIAFTTQRIPATTENLCSVVAITEQESNFKADPAVPGLGKIARAEIDRRASKVHVPGFLIDTALALKSPNGRTYSQRLASAKTERELSAIFDDFIGGVPLGQQLFGRFNPVHTGGPMQVSIAFAQAHAEGYPYPVDGSIRREVFSRRGGMYFGTAHLLGYPVNYPRQLYRFADFNAGWYASRNAAFQRVVADLTGITLALDGDVILYGSNDAGSTEKAVRTLGPKLGMSEREIRRDLELGDKPEFTRSELYTKVFALAERSAGKSMPRAMLPGITLHSPKITRQLTTAWFAQRVDERYQRCLGRAPKD